MNECTKCGSMAINPSHHGREKNVDLDLCDVCYWQKRAENYQDLLKKSLAALIEAKEDIQCWGAYAGEYFQEKHDLKGSVNQFNGLIEEINEVLERK